MENNSGGNKVLDHYLNSLANKVNELNLNKIFLESQLAMKNEEITLLQAEKEKVEETNTYASEKEDDDLKVITLKKELSEANKKIEALTTELKSSEFKGEGDSELVEKFRQKNLKLESQLHDLQVERRKDRKQK